VTGTRRLAALAALSLAALPAAAAPPPAPPPAREPAWPRVALHLGGAAATGAEGFRAERRFTEFAEEAHLRADYARGLGPGLDVGVDVGFGRALALNAAFTLQRRGVSASYEAALPHPLYLARPRAVGGSVADLAYSETAVHLSAVLRRQGGRVRYGLFAGPTWARVAPELVERVQYTHAYPYDAVEVTGLPRGRESGSALGFHAGGTLEYRLRSRVAVALLVRYYGFTPELPDSAGTVELDGGGVLAGLGLRVFLH
jgi:hypothetical protein